MTWLRLGVLAVSLVFAAGCQTYNRQWKEAATRSSTDPFEGRWEGSWLSDHNGHTGRLRCIISRETNSNYQANFQAKYMKTLTFHYPVILQTAWERASISFRGEANLGWMAGGLYRYDGHADATNFFCTYSNRYDYGTFTLRKQ